MNYCRICAQADKQPLIKILNDNPLKVHEKLQKLLKIKVSEVSKLPDSICLDCLTKLNQFNEFYTTAIENQVILEIIFGEKSEKTEGPAPFNDTEEADQPFSEQFYIIEEIAEDSKSSVPEESTETKQNDKTKLDQTNPPTTPSSNHKKRKFDRFDCYLCPKFSANVNQKFIVHFQEKHPDQEIHYTCHICKAEMKKYRSFTRHIESHAEKRFSCDVCDKTFSQKITLVQHMKTHSDLKSYRCTDCGINFKQNSSLFKHRKQKHSTDAAPTCEECQKTFVNNETLLQHKRSKHTAEKTISCPDCEKMFASRSALIYHRVSQHQKDDSNLKCKICEKTFKTAIILKRHMKNVH